MELLRWQEGDEAAEAIPASLIERNTVALGPKRGEIAATVLGWVAQKRALPAKFARASVSVVAGGRI